MNKKILGTLLCFVPVLAIVLYFVDNLPLWYAFDVYVSVIALIAVKQIIKGSDGIKKVA